MSETDVAKPKTSFDRAKLEAIEQRAAEWLIYFDRGEESPERRQAFEAWLLTDPHHHAAYLRVADAWHRTEILKRCRPIDGRIDLDVLSPSSPAASGRGIRGWGLRKPLALAAALLGIAAVAGLAFLSLGLLNTTTYTTAVGSFQRVRLEDGSVLQLNTDSKVRVRMNDSQRTVKLVRGEVYFQIAHDEHRPFDVIAGDSVVRAVGTAFSVRLRGQDAIDVVVQEGRVAIDPPKEALPTVKSASTSPAVAFPILRAGETGAIRAKQLVVEQVTTEQVSHRLGWTTADRWLWFERQPLADIVAEFNRYNSRKMVIVDPAIAAMRVGGGFQATDPESFLAALQSSLPVRADGSDPHIVRLYSTEPN